MKRNGRGHLKAEGENRANSRTAAEQKEILKNSNQDKGKES